MLDALVKATSTRRDPVSSEQRKAFRASTAARQNALPTRAYWGHVSPAEYQSVYPPLAKVSAASPIGALFADGSSSHHKSLVDRKSVEVLTGIYSFDESTLEFQRALSELLDSKLTPELDGEMFTKNGLHTNFAKLRSPAGYLQTPMSYKAVDNASIRKELKLSAGYSVRQRSIAQEVWKLVWAECIASPVNVPQLSAGGMRRFSKDAQWKMAFAQWILETANFERMLNAVDSGDWLTLANEFETVYGMYTQKRVQLDDPAKIRQANDLRFALSGGKDGSRFPTDKKVVINGKEYADFGALRLRVIDAGPWVVNCFLQIVSSGTMHSIFNRWPSVFHVNTAEEIRAVVNGKYVYASDVSEYDQSMSKDAMSVVFETMAEVYDERLVKAARRLSVAPYYARPLELGGREGRWVLDPRSWADEVHGGNRSGHAFTSLIAKVNKVAETLMVLDHMYPVLGRCEKVLRGEMPFGLVNNGDDEIVWFNTPSDKKRFSALRSDPAMGHYSVTPEVGQGFSGLLLVRKGETEYAPSPRLQTALEKIWVPERSIGGRMRSHWPIGINVRIESIMSTAMGREVWDMHMHVYNKILRPRHGAFMDIVAAGMANIKDIPYYGDLTEAEKAVLMDPEKIHYKYRASEIRPSVLEAIAAKMPVSTSENFLKRYYKGLLK